MKSLAQKLTSFGLGFVLAANLVDIVFTLRFIYYGSIPEANPAMEFLMGIDPFLFIGVKTTLVCGGVYGLHKIRQIDKYRKAVQVATYGCFCIYFALVASFYLFLTTPI